METIFHEKQEGQLCAQHALNALLQGSYFTAVDLAQIATTLDERERLSLAEGSIDSREYQEFISSKSQNMDDSGFFSVQVMTEALKVWNLEMIPWNSPIASRYRNNPTIAKAFICNFNEHWFAIRKIGSQWFNLNSLLSGPELISDTYLSLFLTQLQQEGYSIFVINGVLPPSEADEVLSKARVTQTIKPKLLTEKVKSGEHSGNDGGATTSANVGELGQEENQEELMVAIQESIKSVEERDESLRRTLDVSLIEQQRQEQQDLEAAIALSVSASSSGATAATATTALQSQTTIPVQSQPSTTIPQDDDEAMLQEAIRLSMQS